MYGSPKSVDERHRHRYEINPKYVDQLEEKGLKFVGTDEEKQRMEIVELENHPYYVGVQYHPEYLSRPLKPSPPFLGLILASVGKLQSYLNKGCRLSPRELSDNSSGEFECISQHNRIEFRIQCIFFSFADDDDALLKLNAKGLTNGLKNGHTNGTC